jgi:hypothetical protein
LEDNFNFITKLVDDNPFKKDRDTSLDMIGHFAGSVALICYFPCVFFYLVFSYAVFDGCVVLDVIIVSTIFIFINYIFVFASVRFFEAFV